MSGPVVYLDGATPEQRDAFMAAVKRRYPPGEVLVLPACGAIDRVFGEVGPVCTEVTGHDGDHVAHDPRAGLEVSRW